LSPITISISEHPFTFPLDFSSALHSIPLDSITTTTSPAPLLLFSSFTFFLPTQSDRVVNYPLVLLLAAETCTQHAIELACVALARVSCAFSFEVLFTSMVLDCSYACNLLSRDQD
jgi:hypothetical protein